MSSQQRDKVAIPITANLLAEMERTGATIAEVATGVGVFERQVTRWRSGQEPRYEFVTRLARYFGRTPEWFYTNHSDEPIAA